MHDQNCRQQTKTALEAKNRQLQERIKELHCLYTLSKLFEEQETPEQEICQKAVRLLPPAWQYPDIACARLVWDDREYTTPNFQETAWKQTSRLCTKNRDRGFLEVCYVQKCPQIDEGPFLHEERKLLDALAGSLANYLEARELEQQKYRSEEFNRAIVESCPLPVFSLDLSGNVVTWNKAAEQVLGWSAQEVIGRPLPIVPEEKQGEFAEIRRRIAIKGGFTGLEVVRQRKDGLSIDVSLSTAPIYDDKGQVYGIMAVMEDITDRKKTERTVIETAENLRVTLNSIGDGVIATDTKGRITRMNPVAEALTGWALDQATDRPLEQVFHIVNARSGERAENPVNKVLATGMVAGMANHTKLIARGGAEYQISDSGAPITDGKGNTLGVVLVFRDVTEEYRLRKELETSESRFRELFNNINSGVAVYQAVHGGSDFVFLDLNKAGEQIDNINAGSVFGKRVTRIFPQIREFGLLDVLKRVWVTGVPERLPVSEYRDERIVGWRKNFVYRLPSGEVVAVYEDITQRKKAEIDLVKSEKKYRNLFQTMAQGVVYQDTEGVIFSANPAAERILGLSLDQMQGKTSMDPGWEAVDEDKNELSGDRHPAMIALKTRKPVLDFVQGIFNPKVNDYVWIIVNSIPQFDEQTNELRGVYSTFLDITRRKLAEEGLRQSETQFRQLFNSIRDAILVADTEMNIRSCNQAFTDLFGYTLNNIKGCKADTLFHKNGERQLTEQEMQQSIDSPELLYTISYTTKDGQVFPGETSIFYLKDSHNQVTGFIIMIRDVSEQQKTLADRDRLEMQLRQAQKMEAIGRLAGGVAHDFNNLLTTITGNAQLGLMELTRNHELYEILEEIKEAGDRAGNLTRQLLAFSRRQILQPEILDLNDLILNLQKMLCRLIGEDIHFETLLASNLGCVEADPGQMEQVILNLAVNARDAMPDGGKLTIETADVQLDESYAQGHGHLIVPGPYVLLAVSDSGAGMSLEVQDHIFDPFFTTKEKDKGTGLGLSTVYGIVKQSNGNIWVYSEQGRGTTFKIYLPRAGKEKSGLRTNTLMQAELEGSETVLIVEDDPSVRKIAVKNLTRYGYSVLSAATPAEAIALCTKQKTYIDLVLTDVVMPGMSGKELVHTLWEQGMQVKVVYMSGYTENAIVHHGVLDPGLIFLQKPFSPESLAHKVREALDQTAE
jgi:PAS domain S-box-containing protein